MLHQWRGQLFCPEDHEGGFDMSGSNSAERKRHEPLVLVETIFRKKTGWITGAVESAAAMYRRSLALLHSGQPGICTTTN